LLCINRVWEYPNQQAASRGALARRIPDHTLHHPCFRPPPLPPLFLKTPFPPATDSTSLCQFLVHFHQNLPPDSPMSPHCFPKKISTPHLEIGCRFVFRPSSTARNPFQHPPTSILPGPSPAHLLAATSLFEYNTTTSGQHAPPEPGQTAGKREEIR
jgi:hypothetical protein